MKPDPREFRASQSEQWSAAAPGWRKWWTTFERAASGLSERIVELSGATVGDRVLDVATGIGEPALTAARRVGARGRVLGIDLAPQMIEFAELRARELGLSNAQFRTVAVEDLDAGSERFDAAVSRFGLMLMLDPVLGAEAVRRVLEPRARFAAAVWSTADRVPFIALPMEVAEREIAAPKPDPDAPGPLRLGLKGALERVLERGGFALEASETFTVTYDFESLAHYTEFLRDLSGSLRRALEGQSQETCDRIWRAVEKAAERFVDERGHVRMANEARIAVGR
ncbi:MAG: class I SAM-dependent methyltransferase [Planctomycetota bacterium]